MKRDQAPSPWSSPRAERRERKEIGCLRFKNVPGDAGAAIWTCRYQAEGIRMVILSSNYVGGEEVFKKITTRIPLRRNHLPIHREATSLRFATTRRRGEGRSRCAVHFFNLKLGSDIHYLLPPVGDATTPPWITDWTLLEILRKESACRHKKPVPCTRILPSPFWRNSCPGEFAWL